VPEFHKYQAELIGISVDGIWSHLAFAKDRNLHFPLLADFLPRGETAKAYGVFDESIGESGRALFVIDADGVLHYSSGLLGAAPQPGNPGRQ
jgi:peroxiredoxin